MTEEKYSQRFKKIADEYYAGLVKYESLQKPIEQDKTDLDARLMELEDQLYGLFEERNIDMFEQIETDARDRTGLLGRAINQSEETND